MTDTLLVATSDGLATDKEEMQTSSKWLVNWVLDDTVAPAPGRHVGVSTLTENMALDRMEWRRRTRTPGR